MHKHVHSKATYALIVHQFITQQVGKGGKRRNEFSLNTKSMMSMHKHVHSMATYFLIVYQFTTQQVGKGGTNFHSTQNEYAQTCSFNGNLQTERVPVHSTGSG